MLVRRIALLLSLSLILPIASCSQQTQDRPIRFSPPPADMPRPKGGKVPKRKKHDDIIRAQAAHPRFITPENTVTANEFLQYLECRPQFVMEKSPSGNANAERAEINAPTLSIVRTDPDKSGEKVYLRHGERTCSYSTETLDRLFISKANGVAIRRSYEAERVTLRYYELAKGCLPKATLRLSLDHPSELRGFEQRLQQLNACPE